MGKPLEFADRLPYGKRLLALKRARIALWDVFASAERSGALDAAIVTSSVMPNDFVAFFASYPGIGTVYFNGGKAGAHYSHLVLPRLPAALQRLAYLRLPSTSPAHAAVPFAEKLKDWESVKRAIGQLPRQVFSR